MRAAAAVSRTGRLDRPCFYVLDAHEHGDIERIETREAAIAHRFREILGHMAGGGKRREILGRRKPSKELLSRLPSRSPAWALRDLSVHRD